MILYAGNEPDVYPVIYIIHGATSYVVFGWSDFRKEGKGEEGNRKEKGKIFLCGWEEKLEWNG